MSTHETSLVSALPSERIGFRTIGDPYQNYQEKRRRNALQRQKTARMHSSSRARILALEPGQQEVGTESHLPTNDVEDACEISRDSSVAEDADMEPSTSYDTPVRGPGRASRGRGAHGPGRRRQQQRGQAAGTGGGVRAYGQRYGNELMQPEWMTDVPSDLAINWLVMPRPEGMRCLLVTSGGRTVSWLRNGAPLHRFQSHLPGGSRATATGCGGSAGGAGASMDYCLLDCIFHPPNNTYYVLDLLCWRGYTLYDSAAEFRTFWLASKFREEGLLPSPHAAATSALAVSGPAATTAASGMTNGGRTQQGRGGSAAGRSIDVEMGGDAAGTDGEGSSRLWRQRHQQQQGSEQQAQPASYRVVPLPVRPCTLQGLSEAYGKAPPPPAAVGTTSGGTDPWAFSGSAGPAAESGEAFIRDGLYFLHRQGHYRPGPGTTPLALLWKDLGCSRYLLDTDAKGQPLEHQTVVLSYRADRTVATEDEPPVVLGRLPEAFVAAMGDKLKPGRLLRFTIRQGGIVFHEGRPAGADLHYEGPANQRRGRADSFSKILFQSLARTAPITAAALAAAVRAGPQPPESAEGTCVAAFVVDGEGANADGAGVWTSGAAVGAASVSSGGDMAVE